MEEEPSSPPVVVGNAILDSLSEIQNKKDNAKIFPVNTRKRSLSDDCKGINIVR